MQATFSRFDAALIDRLFQPLADSISHWVGLDRLRLAGFCLDGASIAWIMSQAGALSTAVSRWDPGTALPRLVLMLLGLVALSSLRAAFQRMAARRGANPLRVAMLPHRGIAWALLAVRLSAVTSFASAADMVMLGCAVCALYLGACASPPAHGQRREAATTGAW